MLSDTSSEESVDLPDLSELVRSAASGNTKPESQSLVASTSSAQPQKPVASTSCDSRTSRSADGEPEHEDIASINDAMQSSDEGEAVNPSNESVFPQ